MKQQHPIRPYDETDRKHVIKLAEQVIEDGTVFPFLDVQGVADYWFSPGGRVFIYPAKTGIAGTYVIKPNLPGRCAHVANAGYMVNVQHRGQGIGYAMGQHSLETARSLGFRAMQFNIVVSTNASAIYLWKKLGFSTIGTVPKGFQLDGQQFVDLLIMYRDLCQTS